MPSHISIVPILPPSTVGTDSRASIPKPLRGAGNESTTEISHVGAFSPPQSRGDEPHDPLVAPLLCHTDTHQMARAARAFHVLPVYFPGPDLCLRLQGTRLCDTGLHVLLEPAMRARRKHPRDHKYCLPTTFGKIAFSWASTRSWWETRSWSFFALFSYVAPWGDEYVRLRHTQHSCAWTAKEMQAYAQRAPEQWHGEHR